jgi:hypothetical protein
MPRARLRSEYIFSYHDHPLVFLLLHYDTLRINITHHCNHVHQRRDTATRIHSGSQNTVAYMYTPHIIDWRSARQCAFANSNCRTQITPKLTPRDPTGPPNCNLPFSILWTIFPRALPLIDVTYLLLFLFLFLFLGTVVRLLHVAISDGGARLMRTRT